MDNANRGLDKAGRKAIKDLPKTVGNTLRTGAKLTLSGVGMGIGAAATIASGEVKSLPQNMALGATSGNALGNALGNVGEKAVQSYKDAATEHKKDKYGSEYNKKMRDEANKKFKEDSDRRKFYERENTERLKGLVGEAKEAEIDKIMDEAIEYRNENVFDDKLICKAMKLNEKNTTAGRSIAAAKLATKGKDMKGIDGYKNDLTALWGEKDATDVIRKAKELNGLV